MKNFYWLIQGDCFKVLQKFETKSIDLVLTDPPYGISIVKKSNRLKQLNYDPIINDDKALDLSELLRVSKHQIIFGGNYFNLPISRGWIVWDKQGGKKIDFGDCELIWTSFNHPPRILTHIWDGFRRDSDKNIKRVHPAQKPTGLIKILLEKYSNVDDVVLDPFLGSGTTMVACQETGRNCIGIEIDPKYCEIVKKRCFGRKFLDREVEYKFEVWKD